MACILVIEDEELTRDYLEDLLTLEGFVVATANNGAKGVDLAMEMQPDLIICDVMMPRLNGYEVLKRIRQDNKLNTVPFLFLTSMTDRGSSRKGMTLGADDYLEKSCSREELLDAIAVRLSKQKIIEHRIESQMDALRSSITLALPHELQTPLSGIMGLADLMMLQSAELLPEDVHECAQGIYTSAERLQRLIQNYLLYSKLLVLRSRKGVDITTIEVPLPCSSDSIIINIAQKKAEQCDRAGDLEIRLVPAALSISDEHLIKIVMELLDNAFKYSPKGSKVVLQTEVSDRQWLLTLQDYGRGMTEAQIAAVGAYMQFERQFYEQQGIGLGLAIVQNLVELYGGNSDIYSDGKEGTRITITLNLL
jgi:two-component system sensor histidine kinase/response regulator